MRMVGSGGLKFFEGGQGNFFVNRLRFGSPRTPRTYDTKLNPAATNAFRISSIWAKSRVSIPILRYIDI